MRRLVPVSLAAGILVLAAMLAVVPAALAYDEPGNAPESHSGSVLDDCVPCHRLGPSGLMCTLCHAPHLGSPLDDAAGKGPHGLYDATTDRCSACHDVHEAAGPKLLPGATVTDSCNVCHDGTGGKGVYGAIFARTGVDPSVSGGSHRIDVTDVVPGGDSGTGGSASMPFGGLGGNLGCDDCHSPHDAQTVTAYTSERWRTTYPLNLTYDVKTTHLLRTNPGDATATVSVYGSDWCLACHQGRDSGGFVHNHPVDSAATIATPFYYDNVARLISNDPTDITDMGTLAGSNRGYLMPYPRTAEQGTHKPICQQCHEDTRDVGNASGTTADAEAYTITAADGSVDTDNPQFQNFPHETVNDKFLVETHDDLCLNCHAGGALP